MYVYKDHIQKLPYNQSTCMALFYGNNDEAEVNLISTFQTVEMIVNIDCEGCERKVRKALQSLDGTHHFSSISLRS